MLLAPADIAKIIDCEALPPGLAGLGTRDAEPTLVAVITNDGCGSSEVWKVWTLEHAMVFYDEVEEEFGIAERTLSGHFVNPSLFGELRWVLIHAASKA